MTPDQRGRLWLATIGMSAHHGSELLVGWQWYQRLKPLVDVRVLTAKLFDDPKFLPANARADCDFIDTRAPTEAHFPAHPVLHLVRWWRGCRRHLRAHARSGDRLLIASPAAVWFLPITAGLPLRPQDIFYGPLGVTWAPRDVSGVSPFSRRNLRTTIFTLAWRFAWPLVPRRLALRFPAPDFARAVTRRYAIEGVMPDLAPLAATFEPRRNPPDAVFAIHDLRPMKQWPQTLAYAAALAEREAIELIVVGMPVEGQEQAMHDPALAALHAAGRLTFPDRMSHDAFQAFLRARQPHYVSLSNSEAVSATLLEVLGAGGTAHVLAVGGIPFALRPAATLEVVPWCGMQVSVATWNAASAEQFRTETEAAFSAFAQLVASAR
jgi:hypothetical protein